jgi:hypothetical protein
MRWLGAVSVLCTMAAGLAAPPGLAAPIGPAEVYSFWIEPCTGEVAARAGCDTADPELARWALEAWQQAGGPGLRFAPAASPKNARIHFYWLGRAPQLYGEAHVTYLDGRKVWVIDVQTELSQFGPRIEAAGRNDRLFRDTVVYLTCLHEMGHVLALPHTDDFADIMYSFEYGGDVLEYFSRYRRLLKQRPDIRAHTGISESDSRRVAARYAAR